MILPLSAREPLAKRIVHTDPAKYRVSKGVHGGPGQLNYTGLLDAHSLDTNLFFLHRGIIQPKSGIGAHFHNQCEEMFVIFDGEAQFTIDGRTSVLKGPAGAPVRMGHSHAIYNHTDKPIEWMNINVSAMKGTYDAFDLADPESTSRSIRFRSSCRFALIPCFFGRRPHLREVKAWCSIDSSSVRVSSAGPGLTWTTCDCSLISERASFHREVAEFYYVMKGQGSVTISERDSSETAPIREGDAIPDSAQRSTLVREQRDRASRVPYCRCFAR